MESGLTLVDEKLPVRKGAVMASTDITSYMSQAVEWLFKIQDSDNGAWGGRKGDEASTLNTAEAVLVIPESGPAEAGDLRY